MGKFRVRSARNILSNEASSIHKRAQVFFGTKRTAKRAASKAEKSAGNDTDTTQPAAKAFGWAQWGRTAPFLNLPQMQALFCALCALCG